MKKWVSRIMSLAIIFCISLSCKDQKSLQELLQEERKAIDRFISMNDLIILKEYPRNGVFQEREYYRSNEGLFFHVIDSGNGKRVKLLDDVIVRFEYCQYIKNAVQGLPDVIRDPSPFYPFSFVYGIPQTYSASLYLSQGWVIPLKYVGEGAILDMIVPSSLGASTDNTYISPVFFKNLRYTRFN